MPRISKTAGGRGLTLLLPSPSGEGSGDNPTVHVRMEYGDSGRDEIMRASVLQTFALIRRQAEHGSALA